MQIIFRKLWLFFTFFSMCTLGQCSKPLNPMIHLQVIHGLENWRWFIIGFLVGGLEDQLYFPRNIGFLIIPIDLHIFQRGGPTTNQIYVNWVMIMRLFYVIHSYYYSIIMTSIVIMMRIIVVSVFLLLLL